MTYMVISGSLCGRGAYLLQQSSMLDSYLLAVLLMLPLVGAISRCTISANATYTVRNRCLLTTRLTLLCSLRMWNNYIQDSRTPFQQVVGFSISWNGYINIGLEFGVDALSLWMVLLTCAIFPLSVLCSWNLNTLIIKPFRILLLVLETSLLAAFTCVDLLGFYVLYESALLPMFLLINLGGSRPRKVRAAYLLVLYTLVGSLVRLPCVLIMFLQTGSTSRELLVAQNWTPEVQRVRFWGLFLAFAVKVPRMPVHLWLPEAHVEASTAGSVLLAGVLLKLGTYGFLRFRFPLLPTATIYYGPLVWTRCLIAVVYASLTTLRQVDLKKLVAYSSVAHRNLLVLGLFTRSDIGFAGGTFLRMAHGISSPALFRCVGALYDRAHTKALKYLGGAATTMPIFSIRFFFFSLCNRALPLTPNFVAELTVLCSIFSRNVTALIVSLIGVIRSAAYTRWAYARVVHGMPKFWAMNVWADLNRRETHCFIPLVVLALWWGLKPARILDMLTASGWYWQSTARPLDMPNWVNLTLSFI